ncbi:MULTISPECIES: omptin family outer membrane protease [unclassified Acinetobacter]|uniref:omptin family outer membrane protease n=1 Tax=unclassified Acinetobacter TaxID=196816 RepID=UPI00293436BA|nr:MULTISPECIES: omptin family outer membrane protease [unclassified Acinetobacter]WOE30968.1 omptin family outer membrane protease [Acinetobacter sp. SAAs470]WOE39164.1 omptin family outer membrane protease [Acinetobacter sp. SAAs474]
MNKYILLFILSPNLAYATADIASGHLTTQKISVALSSGLMLNGGKAKEFVYIDDIKRSQLNWDIKNAPIIKADLSWQPFSWLSLNANAWTTVTQSSSLVMSDFDYTDQTDAKLMTDWSYHPDTKMKYANQVDLNAQLFALSDTQYKAGFVVGYQQNKFNWNSKGGIYRYSLTDHDGNYIPGTAQMFSGEFDKKNDKGIDYKQIYRMPYIGLNAQYDNQKISLGATVKYSAWVTAKDVDHHYARETVFYSQVKNMDYYGVNLNAGYYIRPDTQLFTAFEWNKYREKMGKTHQTDNIQGQGSLSSQFQNLSLGIKYYF